MKIIGNGMIAQSFKDYDLGSVCVFASGVSDSTESDTSKYFKEYELLKETLIENKNNTFIYFSTLSVLGGDYTEYIKHKLFVEFYIKSITDNFIILRLPNIVGDTKSNKQLIPFLYNSLLNKQSIRVMRDTYRDLIDVADLPKIIDLCVSNNIKGLINVSLNNKIKVLDIIDFLIKINGIEEFTIDEVDGNQNIDYVSDIINYQYELDNKGVTMDPYKIIKKYYKK